MPKTAIKTTTNRVSLKDKKAEKTGASSKARPPFDLLLALVAGALFGLSAPGFGQWYLAWFCLAPFFLLVAGSESLKQASIRGFVFGAAYNLVYLNWYLGLHSLSWMGLNDWQSIGL
ncbi:unnamed protein product, partial [marine sediment metagenome]